MSRLITLVMCLSLILLAFPITDSFAQDVIYGCVNKPGHVRIVDDPNECKTSETAIYWNVVGGQGPQGDPGPPGSASSETVKKSLVMKTSIGIWILIQKKPRYPLIGDSRLTG